MGVVGTLAVDLMEQEQALSELGKRTAPPPISWLMKMALGRPQLVSLAAGFTDNETLPVEATREALNEVLQGEHGQAALQYGSTIGDPELRDLTAAMIRDQDGADGAPYSADRVLITHGSQQLLYILTEVLCDPGDIVLVEDPTYFVYLGALQSHGVECRGVAMDQEGVAISALRDVLDHLRREGRLSRVKMLVSVSYFQNPTGITTSLRRKEEILELLGETEREAGHAIYLLEDAVYRDLRFSERETPSALAATRGSERVLYVGTYSKPFATGIRVGFGVLPESIHSVAARIKGNHDFGTGHLFQKLLVQVIRTGRYAAHVAGIRDRYARKAQIMLESIEATFPEEVHWRRPDGGLYVWAWLPPSSDAGLRSEIFDAALREEILYVPGELCYADDPTRPKPTHEMRLSFGAAPEANIRTGVARLAKVLREKRPRSG